MKLITLALSACCLLPARAADPPAPVPEATAAAAAPQVMVMLNLPLPHFRAGANYSGSYRNDGGHSSNAAVIWRAERFRERRHDRSSRLCDGRRGRSRSVRRSIKMGRR